MSKPASAAVAAQADNTVDLTRSERYCAILGTQPSKGARSPLLWNAVFAAEGMDVVFHPLDVPVDRLGPMVAALKADPCFQGGAVTMPHKEAILPFLDRVEPRAATIGAVNALYRDGDALVGTNTDSAGALASLLAALGVDGLGDRTVVQVGTGGAGTAVAAALADSLGDGGRLILANRSAARAETLAARLPRTEARPLPLTAADVADADIIVNCTSLGFFAGAEGAQPAAALSPLGPVPATTDATGLAANAAASLALLEATPAHCLVFDIVYQPPLTPLLAQAAALGRRTLNGRAMNLEQAVLGFHAAFPGVARDRVRAVMGAVP